MENKNEMEKESRAFSTRTLPIPVFRDDEILVEEKELFPEPPMVMETEPTAEAEPETESKPEAEEEYTGPRHARAASLEAFERAEIVEEESAEDEADLSEEAESTEEIAPLEAEAPEKEQKSNEPAEEPAEVKEAPEVAVKSEPSADEVRMRMNESMLSRTSKLKPIGKVEEMAAAEKKPAVKPEDKKEPKAVIMPEKKDLKKVILHEVFDFIKTLAVCGVCVFLLWTFIIRPVQVKGKSMAPTLTDNAIGVSNTIGYRLNGLERFDIAIIYLEEKDEYIVKRVIGLPGEKIRYENDQLYINDTPISEPFLNEEFTSLTEGSFTKDFEEITLGENEYFCMGDNRPHSQDSRYYGPFAKSQISSKGICILFPFSEFGVKSW